MPRGDGSFIASWGPGEIDRSGQGEQLRLRTDEQIAVVDAALRSGRIGPRSRDRWLCAVAAGGTRGGTAIANLLALYPAGEEVRAGWPGDSADDSDDGLEALYASLYPGEAEALELEQADAERARRAARQGKLAHAYDNSLTASSPAGQRLYLQVYPGG